MKFEFRTFSRRVPAIDCAVIVTHVKPSSAPPIHATNCPCFRRLTDVDDAIECQCDFYYRLVRSGGATGAAIVTRDGHAYFGVALCSPRDQFCKRVGRAKAIGAAAKDYFLATKVHQEQFPDYYLTLTSSPKEEWTKVVLDRIHRRILSYQGAAAILKRRLGSRKGYYDGI